MKLVQDKVTYRMVKGQVVRTVTPNVESLLACAFFPKDSTSGIVERIARRSETPIVWESSNIDEKALAIVTEELAEIQRIERLKAIAHSMVPPKQ